MNDDGFPAVSISRQTPLSYVKKLGEKCDRCGHCCSFGSGYFLAEDIDRISMRMGMKKDDFKEKFLEETEAFNTKLHKARVEKVKGKPYGSCVFFEKEEGCSIHDFKPLHCSIAKGCGSEGEQLHSWFMLNYLVDEDDPESIRQYAKYLEANPAIPGGDLKELVRDKEKLRKILNYDILK